MRKGDLELSIRRAKWIAKARQFIFENVTKWNQALTLIHAKTLQQYPDSFYYPERKKFRRDRKKLDVSWLKLTSKGKSPPNTVKKKRDKHA